MVALGPVSKRCETHHFQRDPADILAFSSFPFGTSEMSSTTLYQL
jgi:hypothetical protein